MTTTLSSRLGSLAILLTLFLSASCQQAKNTDASYEDINVEQFKTKMTATDVVILDVRTPGETTQGMIDGAVEIDFRSDDFQAQISALDKDKTYLVYCKSGGRSSNACEMMQEMGFEKLYNLDGGYTRWSAENQ
ncbi:MAG: rhodanese-like domain-containing protein [Bacteroidota bacterium]